MNRFWERALLPIVDALQPHVIVEVGTSTGALTAELLRWAADRGAVVHSIDPDVQFELEAWQAEHGERFVFHRARSLNVLGRLEHVDAAFLDGDHNWYTVVHELRLIERTAADAGVEPPLIALHDVDWPYGRRDLYYDPDSVPPAHRQPYERSGIVPGEGELSPAGFNDHLRNAIYEHTIHNGVRTAIEDFVAESPLTWRRFHVPGLHGLELMVTEQRLAAHPALGAALTALGTERFLTAWCGEIELHRVKAEIAITVRDRALAERTTRLRETEQELGRRVRDVQAALDRASADREALRETGERLGTERDAAAAEHAAAERALAEQLERGRRLRDDLSAEVDRLHAEANAAAETEAELRRELVAVTALAEQAAERPGAGVSTDGAPLSNAGAIWVELGGALRCADATISETIAERDPMFSGNRDAYLALSHSALRAIVHGLAAAGLSSPETILDLPCGYGRVTRALRAAWPQAELVAADQSATAVAFCVEQFEAEGWEVEDYLALDDHPRQRERFDLIWSASLLSSIDPGQLARCLADVLAMLRPDGLLVAAYHGRDSTRRFSEHSDEGLRALAGSVTSTGVGFRPRPDGGGLGTTAMTPTWLVEQLARQRPAMVVSVVERGWGDHLDVVAIARTDVHHSQRDLVRG